MLRKLVITGAMLAVLAMLVVGALGSNLQAHTATIIPGSGPIEVIMHSARM
jgi:hypothetical protein